MFINNTGNNKKAFNNYKPGLERAGSKAERTAKFISRGRIAAGVFSLGLLILSLAGMGGFSFLADGKSSDQMALKNSLDGTDIVTRLPIAVMDVVYNPGDKMLYASRPGSEGSDGNSISKIDPLNPGTVSSTFVGSEPGELAMSDDGHTLYTFLNGAFAVRRFDTATQTAGIQFSIGSDSGSPYTASDMAVVPQHAEAVVVARYRPGVSPPGAGVAVFSNGIRHNLVGPGHSDGANYLAYSNSPLTLYGGGLYSGLRTMAVGEMGVTDSGTTTSFPVGRLKFDNGTIYTAAGQVIDPVNRTLLGTFPNVNTPAFVPDSGVGRVYYATRDAANSTVRIQAFDPQTFVLIGSLIVPNVTSDPTSLVRYGTNGLAMMTADNKMLLIQTSLIPTSDPLPTPSATPIATPTPAVFSTFFNAVELANKDLAYNAATQKLMASVPSSDIGRGNSLTQIDPATGNIENSVYVGSEPGIIALSDDGQTAYVGIDGAGAVRKYDAATNVAGQQFYLNSANSSPQTAFDIDVMPGNAETVAVSNSYYSNQVWIYDAGIRRPNPSNQYGRIQFRSPEELLIAGNPFFRYGVNQNGLSFIGNVSSAFSYSNGNYVFEDGLLYLSSGRVIDTTTQLIKGTFSGVGPSSAIAVDTPNKRIYFLTNPGGYSVYSIRAYNTETFQFVGSIPLPGFNYEPTRLFRWGTNGLAFRDNGNKIYLLQSTLINPVTPVPTPTPSVSPTPTPTPVNAPTFFRPIDVPANDLVYSQATQSLYASVPATAGVGRGNTITKIDPATGSLGPSVFIGSEPNRLALSADGNTLYSRLDGAAGAIRTFNIPSQTPGLQFTGPATLRDMKVMPGSPQTVAFAEGAIAGVSIYDNGVKRPKSGSGGAYGINTIDFAGANTIYGYDTESSAADLVKFTVDNTGVTGTKLGQAFLGGGYNVNIKYANGLLYSSSGRVVNPEQSSWVGTFQVDAPVFTVDSENGRVFFLNGNILSAYDINTFRKIGTSTLPAFFGAPSSLVRWGTNGLAFRTDKGNGSTNESRVYSLQSSLVSTSAPLPTGFLLTSSNYTVYEGSASFAIFTVTRTGDISGTSSIDYHTTEGTATDGTDYTSVSGTLTFAPGEGTKSFGVPLKNDSVYEPAETFGIVLSNATAGTSLLTPNSATFTIYDNDFPPRIYTENASVNEMSAGSTSVVQVPVSLSNPSTQTVTVNYSTSDITAIAGTDYVSTSGTLTFNPLETSKSVPVTIRGDNTVEGAETFQLDLTNPVNGTIFGGSTSTITINNFVPQAIPRAISDFDGDGKSDVAVWRESSGIWFLTNSASQTQSAIQFGSPDDRIVPGDYDGDMKTDLMIWRPSGGLWYLKKGADMTVTQWGLPTDLPVQGDYDGDGKTDIAVWRPSSGIWFIQQSRDGYATVQFGQDGDRPVPGDYDGDGKIDIGVYRPSTGIWFLKQTTAGDAAIQFGVPTDKVAPADYDGDGKTDLAVYRDGELGLWYLRQSTAGETVKQFGTTGDIPVPGDFDGDGKADISVWRPSNGIWFLNKTTSGLLATQYGQVGDKPIPSGYIPIQ